ncbi:MAG: hypothetical protein KGL39_13750 [Patescibacteria group bacterium]|nr:hypothetical protein [Patescibacteria group bacterium]
MNYILILVALFLAIWPKIVFGIVLVGSFFGGRAIGMIDVTITDATGRRKIAPWKCVVVVFLWIGFAVILLAIKLPVR